MRNFVIKTLKHAKRLVVLVIGSTILAVGIAMIVLPGPAVVVIPIGLAMLASEFIWARKQMVAARERIERMKKEY